MTTKRMGRILGALGLLAGLAGAGDEGGVEARLAELEERLERSERSNEALEREVAALRLRNRDMVEREIDLYLEDTRMLAGGGSPGAETKAGAFVRLYGFIRLDTYYNTARFNSVIVPVTVQPEDGVAASSNDDQFAFDARLTRIGLLFDFGEVGRAKVTGNIQTDFANFPSGVPESRETPRIRLAYIQIETDTWRLRLGQDWDVISPLYPSANNEGVMWNAGNLGDRRPQVAWTWKRSDRSGVTVALGLTGAINNLDFDAGAPPFTSTERDGFDSGHPHVQVRGFLGRDSRVEGKSWTVGLWGFVGTLETDGTFGGEDDFLSWAAGADFTIPVTVKVVVKGEVWVGEALGDIRGNIGQVIDTATGKEIGGWGGWLEMQYAHDGKWTFLAGGTMDDPDNADVPAGSPDLNFTLYAGARRTWSQRLKSGFDVIFWETQYRLGALGNAVRFNFWTSVDF